VKLAAVGDVLRTTCLLPGIHRRWPARTRPGSPAGRRAAVPATAGRPRADLRGTPPSSCSPSSFDVIINPDAAADACAWRTSRRRERLGFNVDARGTPMPLSPAAERWLEMGVRDDKKKATA
jgi:hypothetical protein